MAAPSKWCLNCDFHNWPQPEEGSVEMKKCSGCKFVHYCSKECQVEHWEKVHSGQCKFLAGKTFPLNSHEPANCPGCKQQSSYTRAGRIPLPATPMAKHDNPHYGCHFPGISWNMMPCQVDHEDFGDGGPTSAPLPFALGDITGQFRTRAERCLSLVQRIHYKLHLTGHPLLGEVMEDGFARGCPVIDFFYNMVAELRQRVWNVYYQADPGAMTERSACNTIDWFLSRVDEESPRRPMVIDDLRGSLWKIDVLSKAPRQPNSYCIPDMLLLVFNMATIPYHLLKTLGKLESVLPKEVQELLAASGPIEKLVAVVDKVLELLSTELVPAVQVLKVLCDGELRQLCTHCGSPATVSCLFTKFHSAESAVTKGKAFVTFSEFGGSFYSCGKTCCSKQAIRGMMTMSVTLSSTAEIVEEKYGKRRCDHCHQVERKGHRCSTCLTKLYCSEECQLQDSKVHSKVCRAGEVARKKRGERGLGRRKEEGRREKEEIKKKMGMLEEVGKSSNSLMRCVDVNEVANILSKIKI